MQNAHEKLRPLSAEEEAIDFRLLFESARVGIAIARLDGTLAQVNSALCDMLGYSADELVSDPEIARKVTHPDDFARDVELFTEITDGRRQGYELEKRYVRRDGTCMWARLSISLIPGSPRRAPYAVAIVEDINERKQAEAAAEERARTLSKLSRASRRINAELAVPAIMRALVVSALDIVGGTSGLYGQVEGSTIYCEEIFERGTWKPIHLAFTPGTGIPGYVYNTRKPYRTDNAELDPLAHSDLVAQFGLRAMLIAPVISRQGELLGTVHLHQRERGVVYTEEHVETLLALCTNAAVALENARLYQRARREIAARHQSDERLRLAQQTARTATWDWNLTTDEIAWSEGSAELYGVPITDVSTAEAWRSRIHPADVDNVWYEVMQAVESRGEYNGEFRVVWPNGSVRWLLGRAQVFLDHDGRPRRMIGIHMDLTERKQAEGALHESESRFRQAQAAVKLGAFEWDLGTDEIIWYSEVPSLRGLATDNRFSTWVSHFHPDDRDRIVRTVRDSIELGRDFDVEGRIVRDDGELVWVRAMAHYLAQQNEPAHYVGIAMDITERKLSEEALRNSEKLAATGRMAATIAHEINNPLEAVTNLIFLARNTTHDPNVREWLEMADQELARVSHITKQTLGFYRGTTAPRVTDFSLLVDDIMTLYKRQLGKKNLQLRLELAPKSMVRGVSGELKQVISNLVSNAIDASPHNGPIVLRVRAHKYTIHFTVCDKGYGVAPEHRKRIFEPFFTTKREVGTGLGLWVTKGIVEKHKGSIMLRSNNTPGKSGTIFSVVLPRYVDETVTKPTT